MSLTKWWADITKSSNPLHQRLPIIERQQVYLVSEVESHIAALTTTLRKTQAELGEWKSGVMSDATGHLFRCAKVSGAWNCATGCAMQQLATVTVERDEFWAQLVTVEQLVTRLQGEERMSVAFVLRRDLEQYRKELGEARSQLAQVTAERDEMRHYHNNAMEAFYDNVGIDKADCEIRFKLVAKLARAESDRDAKARLVTYLTRQLADARDTIALQQKIIDGNVADQGDLERAMEQLGMKFTDEYGGLCPEVVISVFIKTLQARVEELTAALKGTQ